MSLDNDASNLPVKCFLPLYSGGAVAGAGVVSLEKKTLGDLITVYKYFMNKQYGKETGLVLWVPKGGSSRNGPPWYKEGLSNKTGRNPGNLQDGTGYGDVECSGAKKVGQFQMASCMGDLRGGTDCVGFWVPV